MAILTGRRHGDTLVVTHEYRRATYVWAVLRIVFAFSFLWAFVDRLFAFGYPTGRMPDGTIDRSAGWIGGGSPAEQFLRESGEGPLIGLFESWAGSALLDVLILVSLAVVGLGLLLGIGMRLAALCGSALLILAYLASLPPEANPLVDHRLISVLVLAGLALGRAGDVLGLGRWWSHTRLVDQLPFLR